MEPVIPQKQNIKERVVCRYGLRDSLSVPQWPSDSVMELYTRSGLLSMRHVHSQGANLLPLWVYYAYDGKGRMITDSVAKAPYGKRVTRYTYDDRKGTVTAVTHFGNADSTNTTLQYFRKGMLMVEVRLDRKSDTIYTYTRAADHSVATWYYYNALKGQPLRRQHSEIVFYELDDRKRTHYNFSATGESYGHPMLIERYNDRGQHVEGIIYQENGHPDYAGTRAYNSDGGLKEASSTSYGIDGKPEHTTRDVYTYEGIHLVRVDHFRDTEKLPRDVDYYQYTNGLLSKILSRQLKQADDAGGVNWSCRTFTYKFYE